jgi:hypothetical protein
MITEVDLFKRRIVAVVSYFDEEHEVPWKYVQRTGDGRFEAIATVITGNTCSPCSAGIFADHTDAVKALRHIVDVEDKRFAESLTDMRAAYAEAIAVMERNQRLGEIVRSPHEPPEPTT